MALKTKKTNGYATRGNNSQHQEETTAVKQRVEKTKISADNRARGPIRIWQLDILQNNHVTRQQSEGTVRTWQLDILQNNHVTRQQSEGTVRTWQLVILQNNHVTRQQSEGTVRTWQLDILQNNHVTRQQSEGIDKNMATRHLTKQPRY
jgi:hypothetical protein